MRDLASSNSPLAVQDLRFDWSFACLALEYLRSGDEATLERLADSAAAAHLVEHARNFQYDLPKDTSRALVTALLAPRSKHLERIDDCARSVAFFAGPMLEDPQWVGDTLRYLPDDFRFHGSVFLTFGYDIGVAFGRTASLNCAHPHFREHPRELLYYAIHELHHVGFMASHPPPKVAELKTCADIARLVEYSTQMEGMAVLAAYERRRQENALADETDYVALQDESRMRRNEARYSEDLSYLKDRRDQPANADAWAVVTRMSSGERLWYRVGARMAQRIEQRRGRAALKELVKEGPGRFQQVYREAAGRPASRRADF